jgi:hypothetical protein
MKRLWLRGANRVSKYQTGTVKSAFTFDTEDGEPAECNNKDEVLLVDGIIRHRAFCLLKAGKVQWDSARLEQQVGGFYKVVQIANGISMEDAKLSSDGAYAACQIASERRKFNYQPRGKFLVSKAGKKRTKSAKKPTKSTKKLGSVTQADLLAINDMLSDMAKGG